MIASRKTRLVVLVALFAMVLVGAVSTSAEAGGHRFHVGHGGHKVHHVPYNFHHVAHYTPLVKYVPQVYTYPVIQYDCYGQPYTIWQTAYKTVPVTYFP